MRRILLTLALCGAPFAFADETLEPTLSNTSCPDQQTQTVTTYGHGTDGELFLDPFLSLELKNLSGQCVLDAGCKTALLSIDAAKNGAKVCGIDLQDQIQKAQVAIGAAGLEKEISLYEGTVEKLPFEAALFDHALSVNLGCQLAKTMHIVSENNFEVTGLGAHFQELFRVLKEDGCAMVTAPASLGVIFTDAFTTEMETRDHIEEVLSKIGTNANSETIVQNLGELKEILRANFVQREGKLVLVTDEKMLKLGEPIWSKTPEGIFANYYHSEEEYLVSLKNAGLTCIEIKRPCFFGRVKYDLYRRSLREGDKGLGEAYMYNHPFTIYYVTKRAA